MTVVVRVRENKCQTSEGFLYHDGWCQAMMITLCRLKIVHPRHTYIIHSLMQLCARLLNCNCHAELNL